MKISENIQLSFDIYKQNFGILIMATLVTGLISIVTLGILAGPMTGGLLILCLKLLRGEKAEFNEIFAHFDKLGSTFLIVMALWATQLLSFFVGQIPVVGMIFTLFAGAFTGIIFMLSIGFVIERNFAPVEAMKLAFRCFMTDPKMIWIYSFVVGLLGGSGAILLFFPIILTAPFYSVAIALAYKELSTLAFDQKFLQEP